jgi:hypothetical protein
VESGVRGVMDSWVGTNLYCSALTRAAFAYLRYENHGRRNGQHQQELLEKRSLVMVGSVDSLTHSSLPGECGFHWSRTTAAKMDSGICWGPASPAALEPATAANQEYSFA